MPLLPVADLASHFGENAYMTRADAHSYRRTDYLTVFPDAVAFRESLERLVAIVISTHPMPWR